MKQKFGEEALNESESSSSESEDEDARVSKIIILQNFLLLMEKSILLRCFWI